MVALPDFTPLQGGVPIVVEGQVVGAVGVSGAANQQQDEEIAMAGANALTGGTAAAQKVSCTATDVTYFDRNRVAAAFAKGEPLFTGSSAARCAVNSSRRETPGQAEVHQDTADVMYIQEGSATLVTGGTVLEPMEAPAGDIRGSGISGGETRMVAKGDVIIVPRGVPHWFKEVNGTLLYYVVKVPS